MSPAKGLLHLPEPPYSPPSRLSGWPAPMPAPPHTSPDFPSLGLGWGLGWGLGACGAVEAKQGLHLLEKRTLGRFPAFAPQNSTPHCSPGWLPAPPRRRVALVAKSAGCCRCPGCPSAPPRRGKSSRGSKRGNWVVCFFFSHFLHEKNIAWHKSTREVKGRGYGWCLCGRVRVPPRDTHGSQG